MDKYSKCVDKYKKEFKNYLKYSNEKKQQYAEIHKISPEKVSAMTMFCNEDYNKIMKWNNELKAMEKVLGISEKESKKIMVEIKEKLK